MQYGKGVKIGKILHICNVFVQFCGTFCSTGFRAQKNYLYNLKWHTNSLIHR